MVTSALTALALIWTFGQQAAPFAQSTLQAVSPDQALAEPESKEPEVSTSDTIDNVSGEVTNEPIISAETDTTFEAAPPGEPTEQMTEALPALTEAVETGKDSASSLNTLQKTTTRHGEGTAAYQRLLERAQTSLSAAKTASGRFVQANADGSIYGGAFALSRPGKLRFDYDDPVPVLIVSDGTTVAMEDRDLETIDRVPLGTTPLGLILNDDLAVTDDIIVNGVIERDITFEIIVEDATGEMPGTLTMVFSQSSDELIGWRAVDAEQSVTRVSLLEVETNTKINPRQFILRDAEDEEDER